MDRELADKLHAELGYRSAGLRELSLREWASLRDGDDRFAKTPAEFERLIGKLRSKAYRAKVPSSIRREREKAAKATREERKAAKAARLVAKARAKSRAEYQRVRMNPVRWAKAQAARHARWEQQKADAAWRAQHVAENRAKRERARGERARSLVYECHVCAVQWCPIRRLRSLPAPDRAICSEACRAEDHRRRERDRVRRLKRETGQSSYQRMTRAQQERAKARARAAHAAKREAKRAAKAAAMKMAIHTCARCGARWCCAPWRRAGQVSSFCSVNCQKYSAPSSQPAGRRQRDQEWRERNRATIAAKARAARRRR